MVAQRGTGRGYRLVLLIAAVVLVAGLHLARTVLVPLALAVLLTFLLTPLVMRLQRAGLPRILAVALVMLAGIAAVSGLGSLVGAQAADLVGKIPQYRENIIAKGRALRGSLGLIGEASQTVQELKRQIATQPASQPPESQPAGGTERGAAEPSAPTELGGPAPGQPIEVRVVSDSSGMLNTLLASLGPLLHPLVTAAIVVFSLFFMLVRREDLRDRVIRLIGSGQINVTTEAMDEAARRVSRFLIALVVINGMNGAAFGAGLALIGVPNALLWGLLAAGLRFIPYVGPAIAAALPVSLSLAIFDGWMRPLAVLALYLVIETLCANVLEPWLYGSQTGASPLAIIISAVFWGWLWGPVGLVLATPMTVCLVVAGKYVPQLEFLSILLAEGPALPASTRFYQRLLAFDEVEAAEVLSQTAKSAGLLEAYDQVLVPALAQFERDRLRELVDQRRSDFVEHTMIELITEAGGHVRPDQSDAVAAELPQSTGAADARTVLCVPARDKADELVGRMLVQLLGLHGIRARMLGADVLAAELVELVDPDLTGVVCISALPPSPIEHARYLVKRLGPSHPRLRIITGLWTAGIDKQRAASLIGCDAANIVTSLAEAKAVISQRLAPKGVPPQEPKNAPRDD